MIIGNLIFKVYFEFLYPLWMVDSLRTSKVHHWMPLDTIGCPLATIDLVGDNREFDI